MQPVIVKNGEAGPAKEHAFGRMVLRVGRALATLAAGFALFGAAQAAVPGPLERPATTLRQPGRSALLGLAQAGRRVVAVGERGVVLLSDDEGGSWRQAARVPVSVTLTGVQFVNERTGWAIGHYGVVLRSDDGGEHWIRQLDGHATANLLLQDAQHLANPRAITEAQRAVKEGADKPLLSLHFVNEREGFVTGAFNLLLVTHDGGQTWQPRSARLDNPKGAHLYALHREGNDMLIAGEQGLLLHSSDAGEHFDRVPTPYAGSFFGVTRDAGGAWLVAGLRGNVLRSTDAGQHWTALTSPAPVSVTAVARDARGRVLLVNQAGQLLTPEADQVALKLVAVTTAQQPASLLRLANGTLLIAGWNGITRIPPESR